MQICLIWAQDQARAIGCDNAIPWHIPEDLERFKTLTRGHPVIMGRATWESLPRKPLPGRHNIVVTSSKDKYPGASTAAGLPEALDQARATGADRCFVIGGERLYAEALHMADIAYITRVQLRAEGADRFAPELGTNWRQLLRAGPLQPDGAVSYVFETWSRAKQHT